MSLRLVGWQFSNSSSIDFCSLWNGYSWVLLPDKVDVTDREIFTDDVTPVVTLGIVPAQPIIEEVVKECGTCLVSKAICFQNSIRLSFVFLACLRPSVELKM